MPNPQGEPTDTLETIEIDGTVYDIAGSGGGGGSVSITVDDLWTNDNSYGIGTYALSEDIDEYDFIEIWYGVYSEYVGSPYLSESKVFSVDTLNELYSDNTSLLLTGYSNRAIYCTLHDTTLSITYSDANTVLKVRGIKLSGGGSSGGTSAEIIPITAGDGTTSRTFTLSKTPKKVTMQGYTSGDGGWYESGYFIWGENFISLYGAQGDRATGGYVGQASITYGQDGKSFTITAVNSFGAFNRSDGWVGNMLVDYGEGSGSSGASSDDMSDMTWTLLDSTTGTGTSTLIPTGAKYLVLVVEFSVSASIVAKESIKNIIKTMDITSKSVWNVGYEWCDTAGNHTYVAMSGDATHVQAYSGHNTVTAKVYAVS